MVRLGINLDHVATLRNARGESYPDPVQAALLAELGGADNITCHLREDRRHIKDDDVRRLKETIQIPLNFEMAATSEMMNVAAETRPHAITLVPEKREELTTEGGLNVLKDTTALKNYITELKEKTGSLISLFVDPNEAIIDGCLDVGADAVEIHTGDFCRQMDLAKTTETQFSLIKPLDKASQHAHKLGLQVHFGHGLHYNNAYWLQHIHHAEEANIGHSVIARSIYVGLVSAVKEMKELINNPNYKPREQL